MRRRRLWKKNLTLYLLILPIFVYFVIFTFYPLLSGTLISLQEFGIMGSTRYVGLDNYKVVLSDRDFRGSLVNTAMMAAGVVAFAFIMPLFIALALNEVTNVKFKRFSQTVLYLPYLFSWVIVIGIWQTVFSARGLVNGALAGLSVTSGPILFFTDAKWARIMVVAITVWRNMGYNCVLFLAAITGLDPTLYESGRIDGTSRMQEILYITIPQLVETMKVVFIMLFVGVLKIFDQPLIMKNGANADQLRSVIMYTYEKGIERMNLGIASTASVLAFFGILALAFVVKKIIKY